MRKTFLTILTFFLLTVSASSASAWDGGVRGALVNRALAKLQQTIDAISLNAAKTAAMKIIVEEVDKLVGDIMGTAGGVITNWEDFLVRLPEEQSKSFMNDMLSGVTQGRDSSRYRNVPVSKTLSYYRNEYEGFGARNEFEFALIQSARAQGTGDYSDDLIQVYASGNSYEADIKAMGEDIVSQNENRPQVTCTDEMRSNMFSSGNLNNFWECTEGINYAPIAYSYFQSAYEKDLTERKRQAEIEAQSSGVTGKKDSMGNVVSSAASLEALITGADTMSMDFIKEARNFEEVIAAAVITSIDRSINQGIGAVKAAAQRQVSNVRKQITNTVKQQARQLGPQAVFKNR